MSKPYRDQKIDRFCYTCHEAAGSVCAGCGRSFCAAHAPRLWRGCASCEAAYATAGQRWAPGGWLGFLILVGGAAAATALVTAGFLHSDDRFQVLAGVAALFVVGVAAALSGALARRFFFRARRARLAAAEEAAPTAGFPFALAGEEPAPPVSRPTRGSSTALVLAIVSLFVGFVGLVGCLIGVAAADRSREMLPLLLSTPNVLGLGGYVLFGLLFRLHERRGTGAKLSDRQLALWAAWASVSLCVGGFVSTVLGRSL